MARQKKNIKYFNIMILNYLLMNNCGLGNIQVSGDSM